MLTAASYSGDADDALWSLELGPSPVEIKDLPSGVNNALLSEGVRPPFLAFVPTGDGDEQGDEEHEDPGLLGLWPGPAGIDDVPSAGALIGDLETDGELVDPMGFLEKLL